MASEQSRACTVLNTRCPVSAAVSVSRMVCGQRLPTTTTLILAQDIHDPCSKLVSRPISRCRTRLRAEIKACSMGCSSVTMCRAR